MSTEIVVERDNDLDLVFHGEQVAHTTSQSEGAERWTEIVVWRTTSDRYVVTVKGLSTKRGERTFRRADAFNSSQDIINYLGTGWLAKQIYTQLGMTPRLRV